MEKQLQSFVRRVTSKLRYGAKIVSFLFLNDDTKHVLMQLIAQNYLYLELFFMWFGALCNDEFCICTNLSKVNKCTIRA